MQNGHESLADYQGLLQDSFDNMQEISSGGGGIIIKAHHKGLDKEVIIKKVIRSKVKALGKTGERDVLKNLKHPYLPQIYDYIERGDDVFTVMEYIPGKSFAEVMQDGKKKFSKKDLVKWTTQLCEVVAYLHAQKPAIIHCDIKPGNIMLTPQGNICLIDFNISSVKTEEGLSSVGYTPGYAPGEQFFVVMERRAKRAAENAGAMPAGSEKAAVKPAMAGGDETEVDAGGDETEVDAGGDETEIDAGGDETEIDAGGDETEIDAGGDETEIDAGGDETEIDAGGDATEIDAGVQPGGPAPAVQVQPTQPKAEQVNKQKEKRSKKKGSEESAMTPDQVIDMLKREHVQPEIDGRTDIYSVGATMYHIATGVKPKPFYEKNAPLQELKQDLPDGFVYLIMKAMMLRPQDRFKNSDEMLKVARKINKLDKRYKRVNNLENILVLIFAALMVGSVLLAVHGWKLMGVETRNKYDSLVNKMAEARQQGDYAEVQQYYDDALLIFPNEANAYYEMALYLFETKDYEKCLDFVYNTVLSNSALLYSDIIDRFYFLGASSYFMLEEYGNSIPYYEEAISYRPNEAGYYRDYVIALARVGKTQEATKALEQAKAIGIVEDVLLLLEGEISYMEGNMNVAETSLKNCIAKSSDNEVLVRAYGKLDEVYRDSAQGDDRYLKRISLLEQARKALPDEYRITLMERLAQVYIDYADVAEDNQYNEKAIQLFKEIRGMGLGYGTFQTDYNIAILYEKEGKYDEAINWLNQMLKERGTDYRWYKRLAFVELARQMGFENQDREYQTFLDYYKNAKKAYEEGTGKNSDTEMQILEERYKDLIDLGWLEE